ncbi:MAG: bifunctional hydroxymethylpyrimidine kinase/phosphomethylpyrimidine kinase, partial [Planctomycetes bacterium]|nr:bifunctional hydroxymethylpyrimidine kinase/phosphomethylpyrimidine kinase [Planctomycetota bacterium]
LQRLLGDIVPDAIKIGMLASDDVLLRIAMVLEGCDAPRVVDPVLAASDGSLLLERRALRSLTERILPGAALVTPNLDEAEQLTGTRDPEQAARALLELGAAAALIKGGHAEGPADDFLLTGASGSWLRAPRISGPPVHGTGCALSSAITAKLARGEPLEEAVVAARAFVAAGIEGASRNGVPFLVYS